MKAILGVLAFLHVAQVLGNTYSLTSGIVGHDFLNHFTFEAIADPTHGRVYV
jgi:hypothetical protein